MSRTIDLLAQAEQRKNNKSVTQNFIPTVPTRQESSQTHGRHKWIIVGASILGIFLFINFGLIFRLFMLAKVKDSEIISSQKGLERLEKSLDKINQQILAFSNDLNKIKKDNKAKLADLEKQIDVQAFMVKNLENAKNTLFRRVNNLESELSKAP